ncbi:MAG: PhnD/SsuA/transferrin family substrate-binding protein [Planctomycetota bacterium]|nr:MAG: PhnD/SsuA/transferrin family substrate-binding protein [Planctomycetota bacterium]
MLGLAGLLLLTGCSTVGNIVDPLNLRGLGEPPIRVGVTKLEFSPPPLIFVPKWSLFNDGLSFHLNKPVSFDLMTPRQIRVHLGTGRVKFAMLSPADYSQIAHAETSKILAVPKNNNQETHRRGLIIVAAKSPIHALSELKNKRFHFMPSGDILNELALGALLDSGIPKEEIDKGILGLELDTHHISSLEVAKSVVLENVAGVIDEADYNKWPEKGGSFVLLSPSKDQVRVIAKTIRVPEGPFVVSINTPKELTDKVRNYLLKDVNKEKLILAPMGYTGFAEPIDPEEYKPYFELHRKLYPPKPLELQTHTAPAQ